METARAPSAKFPMGDLFISVRAVEKLTGEDVSSALSRHLSKDWGDVCEEDREENELSLRKGYRLFSVYHTKDGEKFYVITVHDRSATTVLLPSDY